MTEVKAKATVSGCFIQIRIAVSGWLGFNLLLIILYLGIQRYTGFDTWIWRERLARWTTFNRWVALPDIMPAGVSQVAGGNHGVKRMDTDGDKFDEWVVIYEYDLTRQHSPIAVAIYDNDRGNPPILFPYRLRLPDRDYAAEWGWWATEVLMGDYVKGDTTGRPEILVHGAGPPEEFSLFRYEPSRKAPEWADPRDYPPVYRCIGYFRGDSIKLPDENNRVVVTHRLYDRSQLARKELYEYDAARDTYLDADEKALLPYREAWIDFAFREPEDVTVSEYPEKVVLAYYMRIPNGDFLPLMSTLARERVKLAAQTQNVHAYGLPVMPGRIDRILVQALAYTPQAENIPYVDAQGNTYFGAIVHVEFFYTLKNDPKQEKKMHSVNWFVIREKGEWKLDHVEP